MDGIRLYLRELRKLRNISQRKLAEQIGMSLRGFSDYELGKTEGLKTSMFIRAVVCLGGEWDDLIALAQGMTDDEAMALAKRRVEHPSADPVQEEEIVHITQEAMRNPHFRQVFLSFWSGWKARETLK